MAYLHSFMVCRCFDIFTPEEQKILKKYREENFAKKRLVYSERRAIGKCPLTPEEVTFAYTLDYNFAYNQFNGKESLMVQRFFVL